MENTEDKFENDLLRKYLNPGRIQKAPEGFSVKTMTRIRIEVQAPERRLKSFLVRNSVPIVSVLVIAGLIVISVLLPVQGTDDKIGLIWKYLQTINFSLPQIKTFDLSGMIIPNWLPFAFLMVIVFALFDRFLFRIFHKTGK
ncbi:MAG: hypothetical protein Q8868_07795 [Bacteroidota bacterium]|nr:hypothetical protein [Bacteroidota bacterium]